MPAHVHCPRPLPRDEEARRLRANIAWLTRRQLAHPNDNDLADALARDKAKLQAITNHTQEP